MKGYRCSVVFNLRDFPHAKFLDELPRKTHRVPFWHGAHIPKRARPSGRPAGGRLISPSGLRSPGDIATVFIFLRAPEDSLKAPFSLVPSKISDRSMCPRGITPPVGISTARAVVGPHVFSWVPRPSKWGTVNFRAGEKKVGAPAPSRRKVPFKGKKAGHTAVEQRASTGYSLGDSPQPLP